MNHNKMLTLLDDVKFDRGNLSDRAYVEMRGMILVDRDRVPMTSKTPRRDIEEQEMQLPKVKPIDGKPKRKPPRQSIPSEIAWEGECPKCGVMGGSPCRSIGPLNSGKVTKHMHPERCGATTRLNQRITQSGSSKKGHAAK